jgi:purine-binding chemotaxis protein CheW
VTGQPGAVGVRAAPAGASSPFVTMTLAGQLCAMPVASVRDVLRLPPISPVPLAPPEIAGNLNLRGRIVSAIDLRCRMRLPPAPADMQPMALVSENGGELYALLVDSVVEVLTPDPHQFEPTPATLPDGWARYSAGLYRIEAGAMIVLDLPRLLALSDRLP